MRNVALLLILVVSPVLAADKISLKVLTYNVGLLRAFTKDLVPKVKERGEKLPDAIAALAKKETIDAIVLQEVWEKPHADAIGGALKKEGYSIFRPGKEGSAFAPGNGLLFAVRDKSFVVVEKGWKFFPFKEKAGLELVTDKGMVAARLAPADDKKTPAFLLLTTHLQVLTVDSETGVIKKENEAEGKAQAAQIEQLSDVATEWGGEEDLPALVAGDLNCGPRLGESNYRLLEKEYKLFNAVLELFPLEKQPKDKPLVTWDRENPLVKNGQYPNDPSDLIDHVLHRKGKKRSWTAKACQIVMKDSDEKLKVPLSDHYGTLCSLTLE